MFDLKKMRQRFHSEIPAEADAILAAAKAEGRDVTAEELGKIEALKAEKDALAVQITSDERRLGVCPSLTAGPWASGLRTPGTPATIAGLPSKPSRALGGGKRYAEMFCRDGGGLSNDGFGSLEEYLSTLHSGLADNRLRAAMGSGTGSGGGFLVPEEFAAQLLDKSLENEIVRPRCDVQPMVSDTKKIAGWDGLDHTGGSLFGGFTGQWLAEEGTATDQLAKVRLIDLRTRKLAIFTRASNELIADGMSFEAMLGEAMVAAVGWHLDYAALRGSGAGQPKGVLNDAALIVVLKEAGQAADTINYNNLTKMFARLHPACVQNSVWVASSTTIPQLLGLTIPVQNLAGSENVGGSHYPAMSESNGVFRMLSRPVLFTEKLPPIGDQGDIILADFSQYSIGLRREFAVEKSIHVGWQTDTSGYRCILRADGQGRWGKPFTPLAGSTQSWVVALQAR